MEKIAINELSALFDSVAQIMSENSERLCEMDAHMGDGDLGLTMKKGFGALPGLIDGIDEPDLGKRLAQGGHEDEQRGALYNGHAHVQRHHGGRQAPGRLRGHRRCGICKVPGGLCRRHTKARQVPARDRTVLDAIGPAADAAMAAAAQPGATLETVAEAAVRGADEGVAATRDMTPKFGKAAVFAARAAGVEDQGAVAGQLVVQGLANYIRGGK